MQGRRSCGKLFLRQCNRVVLSLNSQFVRGTLQSQQGVLLAAVVASRARTRDLASPARTVVHSWCCSDWWMLWICCGSDISPNSCAYVSEDSLDHDLAIRPKKAKILGIPHSVKRVALNGNLSLCHCAARHRCAMQLVHSESSKPPRLVSRGRGTAPTLHQWI